MTTSAKRPRLTKIEEGEINIMIHDNNPLINVFYFTNLGFHSFGTFHLETIPTFLNDLKQGLYNKELCWPSVIHHPSQVIRIIRFFYNPINIVLPRCNDDKEQAQLILNIEVIHPNDLNFKDGRLGSDYNKIVSVEHSMKTLNDNIIRKKADLFSTWMGSQIITEIIDCLLLDVCTIVFGYACLL